MIKKINSNKGSAFIIAIIAIVLVGIGSVTITSMVINQIKNTHKSSQNTELKYDTEALVEEVTGEFIANINGEGYKREISEFNIIKMYVELADKLVKSNGIANTEIGDVLKKIENGELLNKEDILKIETELNKAILNQQGNSNPHADGLLTAALDYTVFIKKNLYKTTDLNETPSIENITQIQSKDFIKIIISKLSEVEFPYGQGNNSYLCGNVKVVFNDTIMNKYGYKYLNSLNNEFDKNSTANIYSKVKELTLKNDISLINSWISTNANALIMKIESTKYRDTIDKEISLINNSSDSYLNTKDIIKKYKTTGSFSDTQIRQLVVDRLEIVKFEIDMLVDWIKIMQSLNQDNSGSNQIGQVLVINVPQNIEIKNLAGNILAKTTKVEYNTENRIENEANTRVELYEDDINNIYKFMILKPPTTTVILDTDVEGIVENNKIQAKLKITINSIEDKDEFQVNYEVIDWKKVNTP